MPLELGYWPLRGYGEPSRLLLRYTETEWTDAEIPLTEEGMKSWFGDKKLNLGLDFPNLPYLIDGDVKVTQSVAVIRHLGRKFNLAPSEADQTKADMFEQNISDLRESLSRIAYGSKDQFEAKKKEFVDKLPARVEEIGNFIGAGPYALGERITYVDFMALEYLDNLSHFSPETFESGPVPDYINRMKSLPALKKFYESENCSHKTYAINAPFSNWPGWPTKE